jgi:hypothetical protein
MIILMCLNKETILQQKGLERMDHRVDTLCTKKVSHDMSDKEGKPWDGVVDKTVVGRIFGA